MGTLRRFVAEPYRPLFTLGILEAVAAALVWPLHAAGWIAYPATLHWTLMVQGFLASFVLGFMLTAYPQFHHTRKTEPWETLVVVALLLAVAVSAGFGIAGVPQAGFLAALLFLITSISRRMPDRRGAPPEEFLFVLAGFLFGVVGSAWGVLVALGIAPEPAPRAPLRLLTHGMMLSIVLGIGGLLVPTFSAMRQPLEIPGIARPGERRPRRFLYGTLLSFLVAAALFESLGAAAPAAWLRALVGVPVLILVWKIARPLQRSDRVSTVLKLAGFSLAAGLLLGAAAPTSLVGDHLIFLGGFGLLIQGIATRVVVTHGPWPRGDESRVLRWDSPTLILAAALVRVLSEVTSAKTPLYGIAGLLWVLAWILWGRRAFLRIARQPLPAPKPAGLGRPLPLSPSP
ncbi:MAG TPA: NnrS family protein [Candidatus Eisenbacteria bacterium]|nr:NnrS family protein [Candidatus Eisenbacteria bacterium]